MEDATNIGDGIPHNEEEKSIYVVTKNLNDEEASVETSSEVREEII